MKWIKLSEREPSMPLSSNILFANERGHLRAWFDNVIPSNATHWMELELPEPDKLKDPDWYGMKAEIKNGLCHFENGMVVDLNQPIKDPDWEKLKEKYHNWDWCTIGRISTCEMVESMYEFLKAKYDK